MEILTSIGAFLGNLIGTGASSACVWYLFDEPECPENLIK